MAPESRLTMGQEPEAFCDAPEGRCHKLKSTSSRRNFLRNEELEPGSRVMSSSTSIVAVQSAADEIRPECCALRHAGSLKDALFGGKIRPDDSMRFAGRGRWFKRVGRTGEIGDG